MPTTAQKLIYVSNAADLKKAIAAYSGDTKIVLAAGDYGSVVIKGKGDAGSLTLVSADKAHPATMTLAVANSHDVHLDGLQFRAPGSKFGSAVSVTNSSGVTIEHSAFKGTDPTYADQARGLTVDRADHVAVAGNTFDGLMRGAVFSNSHDLAVIGNKVSDNRSEGFNFAAVQNVEVAHNAASNFHPQAGDTRTSSSSGRTERNQPRRTSSSITTN